MKAVKENKVYRIETEADKQRYLKSGYDIYSDDGTLVEHSPLKKIAYGKYAELEKKVTDVEKENDVLRAENEALKAENENLKKAYAEATVAKKEKSSKAGE